MSWSPSVYTVKLGPSPVYASSSCFPADAPPGADGPHVVDAGWGADGKLDPEDCKRSPLPATYGGLAPVLLDDAVAALLGLVAEAARCLLVLPSDPIVKVKGPGRPPAGAAMGGTNALGAPVAGAPLKLLLVEPVPLLAAAAGALALAGSSLPQNHDVPAPDPCALVPAAAPAFDVGATKGKEAEDEVVGACGCAALEVRAPLPRPAALLVPSDFELPPRWNWTPLLLDDALWLCRLFRPALANTPLSELDGREEPFALLGMLSRAIL